MSDAVVRADGLGKVYTLGRSIRGGATLRETLYASARGAARRVAALARGQFQGKSPETIWSLRDVSFEVARGEALGIIGPNGAGKTTLLKILSRITEPTTGRAVLRGRVGSLLEVGTGFHLDLTGRENIYLNGAILGMRKSEIDRKFDEIVAFSEVERFLDTAVKHYSSGMYLRLAFAVAAHLETEILFVDEVLAVGDLDFQRKCLGKMEMVTTAGRTVLFVSHNMAAISALCSRALVLHHGQVIAQGSTNECIAKYAALSTHRAGERWVREGGAVGALLAIMRVESRLTGEQPALTLGLDVALESRGEHRPAYVAVDILDSAGGVIMQALPRLDGFLTSGSGQHRLHISVHLPPLIPGVYFGTVWTGSHFTETLDEVVRAVRFEVHESPTVGRSYPHSPDHGRIVPPSTVSVLDR